MEIKQKENLFRGIRTDGGGWAYGCYDFIPQDRSCLDTELSIIRRRKSGSFIVKPETVTQYIGVKDTTVWKDLTELERTQWVIDGNISSEWHGKKIFEADILSWQSPTGLRVAFIEYHEDRARFICRFKSGLYLSHIPIITSLKIIGTIFENLELLENGK